MREAAARETREEVGIDLDPAALELYSLVSVPEIAHVHVLFRVALAEEPAIHPGSECLDANFFAEHEYPWDTLAYGEVLGERSRTIFQQLRSGDFAIHLGEAHLTRTPPLLWVRQYQLNAAKGPPGEEGA